MLRLQACSQGFCRKFPLHPNEPDVSATAILRLPEHKTAPMLASAPIPGQNISSSIMGLR